MQDTVCMQRSEQPMGVSPSTTWVLGLELWSLRLGRKHLYLLTHLAVSMFSTFLMTRHPIFLETHFKVPSKF